MVMLDCNDIPDSVRFLSSPLGNPYPAIDEICNNKDNIEDDEDDVLLQIWNELS